MQEEREAKLWFASLNGNYYLVPTTVTLEPGSLELYNYFGNKQSVDEVQADAFQVPREEAMEYVRTKIENFFSDISERLEAYISALDLEKSSKDIADIIAPMFSSEDILEDDGDVHPLDRVNLDQGKTTFH